MHIIRPHSMPPFWWLVPWAYARQLHRSANAVRELADHLDDVLELQGRIIIDQSEEIANLRDRNEELYGAILRGACTPDARPVPEDCES